MSSSWSFVYEGSPDPAEDDDCATCVAVATKKCRKGAAAHEYIFPDRTGPPNRLRLSEFEGMLRRLPEFPLPEMVDDPTGAQVDHPLGERDEKGNLKQVARQVPLEGWLRANFSVPLTDKEREDWLVEAAAQVRRHCPSCVVERRLKAGKDAACMQHCGLAKALELHPSSHVDGGPDVCRIPEDQRPSWEAFAADARALLAALPPGTRRVRVEGKGVTEGARSKYESSFESWG